MTLPPVKSAPEFLVIAGLSGAGRSSAADTFEDLGWFVIDNLPPALIGKVADLVSVPGTETDKVALVVGTGAFLEELPAALEHLKASEATVKTLFLEASDAVLIRRYEGTRRRHPLSAEGVKEAINQERLLLGEVKSVADVVIDTSELNVHQLRDRLVEMFSLDDPTTSMRTTVMSFGYKYGIPRDVDLVFDCRFLPNPHWVDELRPHTGLNEDVREYVLRQPETGVFLDKLNDMLELLLPAFVKEGKSYLTIALGCTGGRHRSVVLTEEVAKKIRDLGFAPNISHRDIAR